MPHCDGPSKSESVARNGGGSVVCVMAQLSLVYAAANGAYRPQKSSTWPSPLVAATSLLLTECECTAESIITSTPILFFSRSSFF